MWCKLSKFHVLLVKIQFASNGSILPADDVIIMHPIHDGTSIYRHEMALPFGAGASHQMPLCLTSQILHKVLHKVALDAAVISTHQMSLDVA